MTIEEAREKLEQQDRLFDRIVQGDLTAGGAAAPANEPEATDAAADTDEDFSADERRRLAARGFLTGDE